MDQVNKGMLSQILAQRLLSGATGFGNAPGIVGGMLAPSEIGEETPEEQAMRAQSMAGGIPHELPEEMKMSQSGMPPEMIGYDSHLVPGQDGLMIPGAGQQNNIAQGNSNKALLNKVVIDRVNKARPKSYGYDVSGDSQDPGMDAAAAHYLLNR